MSSITWRSRVLSGLFAFFIGHPATLKMPADFAYIPADRALPPPNELSHDRKVKRIYVDHVRRSVTQKVGVVMTVIALLITGITYLLNGAMQGVGGLVHGVETGHSSGWFHSSPNLNENDQAKVNQFLESATTSTCREVSQRAQAVQIQNQDRPLPPVLDALLQGCRNKFGDTINQN